MVWGFLMALLFNIMMKALGAKNEPSLIVTSGAVFISYFISDHYYNFSTTRDFYLEYFTYDWATITFICLCHLIFRVQHHKASVYIYIGLLLNSLLFLAMHVDIVVRGNSETWWLWKLYSLGVNVLDFIMICALIIGRDFLGIVRFSRWIKGLFIQQEKALS